jgi:hypothetical protein
MCISIYNGTVHEMRAGTISSVANHHILPFLCVSLILSRIQQICAEYSLPGEYFYCERMLVEIEFFFFFFGSTGVWTQGFILAKQAPTA